MLAIPDGRAGIAATLDFMVELTREFKTHPSIRQLAEQIVSQVPGKSWYGEAQAVQDWVRDNIRYIQDPYDVEMVKTPWKTYLDHAGDCDDMSTLAATLLQSIGHPVRYVAVATESGEDFNHVYVETKIGSRWIGLETTEDVALGWTPQPQYLRMVRNV